MKDSGSILPTELQPTVPLPQVDVLIPFHRIDSYLNQAIASALASKGVILRVIAINDSQVEISKESIGLRPSDLLLESEFKGNLGAIASGLNHCEAEFVAFLDSDDLHEEMRLKNQIELMLLTGADISSCNLRKFSGLPTSREIKSISGVVPKFKEPELKLVFGAHGADSSLVIRLKTIIDNRELRSRLPLQFSDYPWLLMLILGNAKYAHLDSSSYLYRTHQQQISRSSNLKDVWFEIFPIWLDYFEKYIVIEENISPNLGLLIAFPSSLANISKDELRILRNIKRQILAKYPFDSIKEQTKFEILLGIRELIGRRGKTHKTLWVGPYIVFQLLNLLVSGNSVRQNNK